MEFIATLIAITTILIAFYCGIVEYLLNKLHIYNTTKCFPGPKGYPIIGNAHFFMGNTEDIANQFLKISNNHKSLWRLWIGMKLLVIVDNPEYIKTILNGPYINNKGEDYEYMKPAIGNGLFNAPESVWNPHRKLLNEDFLEKYLKSHMGVMVKYSIILIEKPEILFGEELDV